jgi:hypothetical protein
MRSIETRGPSVGKCSICQKHGDLTVDHVPPKGAIRVSAMEMTRLISRISANPKKERPQLTQNGVKFRSLCATCNNVLLGAGYDKDLIAFTAKVGEVLKSSIALPAVTTIPGKPHGILRSVIGHMLGAGVGLKPSGTMGEAMASYFLDQSKPIPKELDCYYWPYPYNDQVIVHVAALVDNLGAGQPPTVFKLIKFFPLAFLLTWDNQAPKRWQLENLCDHRRLEFHDVANLRLRTQPVPHQLWPETPQNASAVMFGPGTLQAKPVYKGVKIRKA